MIRFLILLTIILSSCASDVKKNRFDYDLNPRESISFNEFKLKLEEYVKNSSYPNINNWNEYNN